MKASLKDASRRALVRNTALDALDDIAGDAPAAPPPVAPAPPPPEKPARRASRAKAVESDADGDILTVSVQLTRKEWGDVKDVAWKRYEARGKRGRQDASAVVREALALWFEEVGE